MKHIIKSVMVTGMLLALLSGCRKEVQAPAPLNPKETSSNPAENKPQSSSSSETYYCNTAQQTSIDGWRIRVHQYLGSTSTVASYYVHYYYSNASTGYVSTASGWIPVSAFPFTLPHGTGFGSSVTNIQVKETRCLTTPWGTNCSDQFYSVPRC